MYKNSVSGVNPGDFVKAGSGAYVPPFRCYLTYSGSSLNLCNSPQGPTEYGSIFG